jgi:hypothetical protein
VLYGTPCPEQLEFWPKPPKLVHRQTPASPWPRFAASIRRGLEYGPHVQLRCEECWRTSDERAVAWVAMLAEDLEEDEYATVIVYCPACAAREFDIAPRRGPNQIS